MGRLTPTVFNESCCDGGACAEALSAQPCGCDEGANWICARHTAEREEKRVDSGRERVFQPHQNLNTYREEVINRTWNYAGRCETTQDEIMNAILGLTGEAGECADLMKKMFFHTEKPAVAQVEKLVLELGDVLFYWLKLAQLFNIDIDHIIDMNRKKLESRHPELGLVTERFGPGAIR